MSDFARALYADLLDTEDAEDLDNAMREWSLATPTERSFAQVQLLWLIHGQLSELTAETTTLSEVLRLLNTPTEPEVLEVDTIDAEVIDG
jgi:hypothetical protein